MQRLVNCFGYGSPEHQQNYQQFLLADVRYCITGAIHKLTNQCDSRICASAIVGTDVCKSLSVQFNLLVKTRKVFFFVRPCASSAPSCTLRCAGCVARTFNCSLHIQPQQNNNGWRSSRRTFVKLTNLQIQNRHIPSLTQSTESVRWCNQGC